MNKELKFFGEVLSVLPTLLFLFFPFIVGGFALFVSISENHRREELATWKILEGLYRDVLSDSLKEGDIKYLPSALSIDLANACLSCEDAPREKLGECFERKMYRVLREKGIELNEIDKQIMVQECVSLLRSHGLYSL